jgi:predicted phosphohydrolase
MSIWAISDFHLSFGVKNKPMNIFGDNWSNYEEKIESNCRSVINPEDTLILAGDFSWGTYMEESLKDFEFLSKIPGRKVIIKGNHDYWWDTISKLKKFVKDNNFNNIEFLHNNFFEAEGVAICGTRGWEIGNNDMEPEQDAKVANREKERLIRSLDLAKDYKEIIVVTHYNVGINSEYIEILKKYNVKKCVYGHLHGKVDKEKINYQKEGIDFICTSCDLIDFKPIKVN